MAKKEVMKMVLRNKRSGEVTVGRRGRGAVAFAIRLQCRLSKATMLLCIVGLKAALSPGELAHPEVLETLNLQRVGDGRAAPAEVTFGKKTETVNANGSMGSPYRTMKKQTSEHAERSGHQDHGAPRHEMIAIFIIQCVRMNVTTLKKQQFPPCTRRDRVW